TRRHRTTRDRHSPATKFLTSRMLPSIGVDPFTAMLNGVDQLLQIFSFDCAGERLQLLPGRSKRSCLAQRAGKVQYPALFNIRQLSSLLRITSVTRSRMVAPSLLPSRLEVM